MKNRVSPLLCSLFALVVLAAPAADTPVAALTIIAFDTETTGLSPTRGHIVELGAVKYQDGKIVGEKNWLINPGEPIPAAATAVHHITDDMVKDKPRFAEIYPEFKTFVGDGVLMAHNAPFDIRFMREEIKRIPGEPLPENKVLDSLRLFRHWMPGLDSYQLSDLARHVGLEEGQFHRATDDARFTVQILDKVLAKKAADNPTLESLEAAGVRPYCIAQPAAEPAPDDRMSHELPALESAASRPGLFLRRFDSPESIAAATVDLLRESLGGTGGTARVVMLSGGRTPLTAYAELAAHPEQADPTVLTIFSDERVVPRNSPDNNFHQALPFLEAWGLVGDRAIAVHTELPALQALEVFQHKLARLHTDGVAFPLALLGIGADGHTAGLFSREHLEQAAGRCAFLVPRPDGLDGITTTPLVLSWFNRVVVLATGVAKRPRITEWLSGSADVIASLATASCPHVEIWADPEAAP